jgi:hypothetical protein
LNSAPRKVQDGFGHAVTALLAVLVLVDVALGYAARYSIMPLRLA